MTRGSLRIAIGAAGALLLLLVSIRTWRHRALEHVVYHGNNAPHGFDRECLENDELIPYYPSVVGTGGILGRIRNREGIDSKRALHAVQHLWIALPRPTGMVILAQNPLQETRDGYVLRTRETLLIGGDYDRCDEIRVRDVTYRVSRETGLVLMEYARAKNLQGRCHSGAFARRSLFQQIREPSLPTCVRQPSLGSLV